MNRPTFLPTETDVLIAGAGPTGLMLALWLARLGVSVRVIDPKSGPSDETRAIVVQARTLEFYDQLGLGEEARARGQRFDALSLWVKGQSKGEVSFGNVASDLTPHPQLNTLTQDQNENLLVAALQASGVQVEWGSKLTDFTQDEAGVTVRLETPGGSQSVRARYLAGCDGGRSLVRTNLGLDFSGGTHSGTFFVADTTASGTLREDGLNLLLNEDTFCMLFPMKGKNRQRIVGLFPEGADETLGFEAVRQTLEEATGVVNVEEVHWFSLYRVHHRVAEHFRVGRAFLLGDAGHLHSPLGGQGMNTGLGDAVNLAWKLEQALRDPNEALLGTYEAERMPFARALIRSTDRAFGLVGTTTLGARLVRTLLIPTLLPGLSRPHAVRRALFRRLSQLHICYPKSPISVGQAGRVRSGDRLPWVKFDGRSNFEALKSLTWQLHVYGEAPDALKVWCKARALPLHVFPLTPAAKDAGFTPNAVYLVRPDGYIGLALPAYPEGDAKADLTRYAETWMTTHRVPNASHNISRMHSHNL